MDRSKEGDVLVEGTRIAHRVTESLCEDEEILPPLEHTQEAMSDRPTGGADANVKLKAAVCVLAPVDSSQSRGGSWRKTRSYGDHNPR